MGGDAETTREERRAAGSQHHKCICPTSSHYTVPTQHGCGGGFTQQRLLLRPRDLNITQGRASVRISQPVYQSSIAHSNTRQSTDGESSLVHRAEAEILDGKLSVFI